ncbi:hypothetical protein BKP42_15940 [Rhodococcus erythropolis]|nr:hypothetical protein BKP42_15940 [Rhodococcus erythropolis]
MIFELRPAHVARALAALCAVPILWTFAVEGITTTTEYDYSTGEVSSSSDLARRSEASRSGSSSPSYSPPAPGIWRSSAPVGPRQHTNSWSNFNSHHPTETSEAPYRFRSPARRRLLGTAWPTISSATAAA